MLAALTNPKRICHRLLVTVDTQTTLNPRLAEILQARPRKVPVRVVERRDIEAILPHAVHQGIALDCMPLAEPDLLEVIAKLPADRALLVVLDQLTDPHNVGAILRSAAAFGVAAVIVTERHAPHETGALAKAAAGALEIVPIVRVTNLARAMRDLKDANIWCLGLDGEVERTIDQTDTTGRVALVLGAEGTGLRRLTRETCDLLMRIPMAGATARPGIDSLNVSNAAAVAIYALSRKGS